MNIAYIRISTNKQDTENQKHRLLEYAQSKKIVIDDFIEVEISSRKNQRLRGIDDLISKLNTNDNLFLTELSRLGRNMLEVLNIINSLREKHVNIFFINQPELSTSDNEALDGLKFAIYGFLAQSERDFISQRTKQGLANARAKGKQLGHRRDFLKSKYDDYEKEIYKLRNDYNMSFNKICVMLDKDKSKGFKMQSLQTWFNKRYEFDKIGFNVYQKTDKYLKHLEDIKRD
jgi:DNA invertase Pin-like site-specific DNA recombinase